VHVSGQIMSFLLTNERSYKPVMIKFDGRGLFLCAFFFASVSAFSTTNARAQRPRSSIQRWADSDPPKWSVDVDEFAERVNSAKAAAVGAVVGSLGYAPFGLLGQLQNLPQVR